MAREMKQLSPLVTQGLSKNQASSQSQWEVLKNIRVHQGVMKPRPGLVNVNSLLTAPEGGAPQVLLFEHDHEVEILWESTEVAALSGAHDAWTVTGGTDPEDVLGEDPDKTTYVSSNTVGAKTSVKFSNPVTVDSSLQWVMVRAYILNHTFNNSGGRVKLYIRVGGVDKELPVALQNGFASSPAMYNNPADGEPWAVADLQGMEVVWEIETAGSAAISIYYASVLFSGFTSTVDVQSYLSVNNASFMRLTSDFQSVSDVTGDADTPTVSKTTRWDSTVFNGAFWITNGTDDLSYYPDTGTAGQFEDLTSQPVGKTLTSFASRLWQGDVTDSGTRYATKVYGSKINDATDWGADAVSYVIGETPGAVVKLMPKSEISSSSALGVLVIYKELGIYHMWADSAFNALQGDDPFKRKLMVSTVGCTAKNTVQSFMVEGGMEAHIFLGMSDGSHLNVFTWDGQRCADVGDPIKDDILANVEFAQLRNAFSTIDSERNYILAIPTVGNYPTQAWVYNLDAKVWTIWEFPDSVCGFSQWHISGKQTTVCGRENGEVFKLDINSTFDDAYPAAT